MRKVANAAAAVVMGACALGGRTERAEAAQLYNVSYNVGSYVSTDDAFDQPGYPYFYDVAFRLDFSGVLTNVELGTPFSQMVLTKLFRQIHKVLISS